MTPGAAENCQEIKFGSEYGLSFEIPAVVNSKYGSASNLKGVIPFLLPFGDLSGPATVSADNEKYNAWVREQAAEYAFCFPNDLDEDILKKMKDYLSMGACLWPRTDMKEPGCKSLIATAVGGFVADDVYDGMENTDSTFTYAEIQKFTQLVKHVMSGLYTDEDELFCPLEAMIPLKKLYWKIYTNSCQEIKDFPLVNKDFLFETMNTIRAGIQLKESKVEAGVKTTFSTSTTRLLKSNDAGFLSCLEYLALHKNIFISEEVRKDVFFEQACRSFRLICSVMNDVLGVGRDIRNKDDNESHILINVVATGISLQEAFDDALGAMLDGIQDFKAAAKLLRQTYVSEQNVTKFIGLLEDAIDGQLYGYSNAKRYGETTFKNVRIN